MSNVENIHIRLAELDFQLSEARTHFDYHLTCYRKYKKKIENIEHEIKILLRKINKHKEQK
ncbi:MAG: hypothetical protein ACK4PR_06015 [Gammaproteobacteria bacterium]